MDNGLVGMTMDKEISANEIIYFFGLDIDYS